MARRTMDDKINDATLAVMESLDLSATTNFDTAVAINDALTPIISNVVTSDFEEDDDA